MATLSLAVVPALVQKSGKHTIRVSVTHNGKTRYITTGYSVDNEKDFRNGKIIKGNNKEIINVKLRKELNRYEERCENIPYIDTLTCSQLISMLRSPVQGEKHRTVSEVRDEFLQQIDEEERLKSYKLYKLAVGKFVDFAGPLSLMEQITPVRINSYIQFLGKQKLSQTTVNIYVTLLKVFINYAVKNRYVTYEVSPFITAKVPRAKRRETHITVEQLKMIRDCNPPTHSLSVLRDIFMLTYYLAGMNLVDILEYDFRHTDVMDFVRRKTRNTKDGENGIRFTIPDEAKPIISRYMDKKSGRLVFGRYKTYVSCYNVLARKMKDLAVYGRIRHDFTLYSARKSFVQHGFELGIPLSTLEYCIGQSMKESRPIFNYLSIMQKHADLAIREILDNLK